MGDSEEEWIEEEEEVQGEEEEVAEEYFGDDFEFSEGEKELKGDQRRSPPVLGNYALVKLLETRVAQLAKGSPTTLLNPKSTDSFEIAKQELKEKVIPLKIVRRFHDGTYEIWLIKEFKYFPK